MYNLLHLELNLSTSWQKCLVKLLDVQKEMVAQCTCLAKSIISLEDTGIVGGQIPLGAGLAFADQYNGNDSATLCFMGDGAVRQGAFHEALNLAMLWKLPVIFIVENNGYAMGTSVERTANHTEIWKLGLGYEMPCGPVDGMDPVAMYEAVAKAVARARKGDGPTLLEAKHTDTKDILCRMHSITEQKMR